MIKIVIIVFAIVALASAGSRIKALERSAQSWRESAEFWRANSDFWMEQCHKE